MAFAVKVCLGFVALVLLTPGLTGSTSAAGTASGDGAGETAEPEALRTSSGSAVLPCRRPVVLTTIYRDGDLLRFEGAARTSARGNKVRIRNSGKAIASTVVRSDGTFAASIRDKRRRYRARSEFRAAVGGGTSWPRRLAQAVEVRKGKGSRLRIRVRGRTRSQRIQRVVVARQTGCRKQRSVAVKQLGTAPTGGFRTRLPRLDDGSPYAIYRLLTGAGDVVSAPILVRAKR